eukprot:gene12106-14026_t
MLFARVIVFLGASTVLYAFLHGLRLPPLHRSAFLKRNTPKPRVGGKEWLSKQESPTALHSTPGGFGFFTSLGNTVQALVREISGPEKKESVDIQSQKEMVQIDSDALQLLNSKPEAKGDIEIVEDAKPDERDFGEVVVNVSRLKVCKKTILGEYSGAIRDSQWHGQGKLTGNPALGHVLEGHFHEGNLVSGAGVVALRTGTVLEGTWVEGILHGPGKIVSPLGHVQEGVFDKCVLLASDTITYTASSAASSRFRASNIDIGVSKTTKITTPLFDGKKSKTKLRKAAQENTRPKEAKSATVKEIDGYVYTGALRKGLYHGQGSLLHTTTASVVEGEWRNNRIYNGKGVLVWRNGDRHEGTWVEGKLEGQGKYSTPKDKAQSNRTLIEGRAEEKPDKDSTNNSDRPVVRNGYTIKQYPNGDRYEGVLLNGHRHGVGSLTTKYGTAQGEWVRNKLINGTGPIEIKSGTIFNGTWVIGKLEGFGNQFGNDGTELQGEFKNGKIYNGSGVLVIVDDTKYEGAWVQGKFKGHGIRTNPDGTTLEGEWRESKIYNGGGVLVHSGGTVFEGKFLNGKKEGWGKNINPDGTVLEGVFKEGNVYSGTGVLILPCGTVYDGTWVEGKMTGQGKKTTTDGYVYEGQWVNGKEEGIGKSVNPDGSVLEGEFKNGAIHNGSGVLVLSDGRVHQGTWVQGQLDGQGTWVNGVMEGHGKQTNADGTVLEGEFRGGNIYNGSGVLIPQKGVVREGTWTKGKMQGQGKRTQSDGAILEGEWKDGKIYNGVGVITWPSGVVSQGRWVNGYSFEGSFVEGKPNGQGKRTNKDGSVLEGEWKNGKIYNGSGVLYPPDGTVREGLMTGNATKSTIDGFVYSGEVLNAFEHGYGVLTYPDGNRYEGNWVTSKQEGAGKKISFDGRVVEGEFRDGTIFNGKGVLVHPDGVIHEGTWVEGKMEGPGKCSTPDGYSYTGTFHHSKEHGPGRGVCPGGIVYEGEWDMGKWHGHGKVTTSKGKVQEGEFQYGKFVTVQQN